MQYANNIPPKALNITLMWIKSTYLMLFKKEKKIEKRKKSFKRYVREF